MADPVPSGRDPVRVFDLVRVSLDELHGWLEERRLRVAEHSANWGERIVVEVKRDDRDNQTRT